MRRSQQFKSNLVKDHSESFIPSEERTWLHSPAMGQTYLKLSSHSFSLFRRRHVA